MPSRRTLLTGLSAGLAGLATPAAGRPATDRLGHGVDAEGTRVLADFGFAAATTPSEAFDAGAVTAVSVAEDELGAVESFALGVDLDGSFRARVTGTGVSVADARAALRAVGLPAAAVDGLPPVARDDCVEFHGSFAARDGEQPFVVALLLVLLTVVHQGGDSVPS